MSQQALQNSHFCGPGARKLYVSYLSTSELIRVEEVERRRLQGKLSTAQRELHEGIWDDVREELRGRQLRLWDEPKAARRAQSESS